MGNNSFATWSTNPNCFIVQNIAPVKKTIRIFNYPINHEETRDLLRIPGVAESDIRASLLKGELNHKIRAQEITVLCSDIDLTQYNLTQKYFLQSAGIINGLEIGSDQITSELDNRIAGGIPLTEHERLRQFVHLADSNGPGDGFDSGALKETLPFGSPFPTNIIWWLDIAKTKKLIEKLIIYNPSKEPTTITWNLYNIDGITIIHTITDIITYTNNVFETTRVRSII